LGLGPLGMGTVVGLWLGLGLAVGVGFRLGMGLAVGLRLELASVLPVSLLGTVRVRIPNRGLLRLRTSVCGA
jgi:hypothetical protein